MLKEYRNKMRTSQWTIVEILLISKEFGIDPEVVVTAISQLARIDNGAEAVLAAAHLVKKI